MSPAIQAETKSDVPGFDDGGEQGAVRVERRRIKGTRRTSGRTGRELKWGQWAAQHCGNRDSRRKFVDNEDWWQNGKGALLPWRDISNSKK